MKCSYLQLQYIIDFRNSVTFSKNIGHIISATILNTKNAQNCINFEMII